MKLKTESLIDFVANIDYIGKKGLLYFGTENDDAEQIAESVIPYYLENYHTQTFEQIYKMVSYDSLEPQTIGYYIGVPYCRIEDIEVACLYYKQKYEEELIQYIEKEQIRFDNDRYLKIQSLENKIGDKRFTIDAISRRLNDGWEITTRELCLYEKNKHLVQIYEKELESLKQQEQKEIDKQIGIHKESLYKKIKQTKSLIIQQYKTIASQFEIILQEKVDKAKKYKLQYESGYVVDFFCFILKESFYLFEFDCNPKIEYNKESRILIVDYYLPTFDEIPNIKTIKKYKSKTDEIKYLSNTALNKLYDDIIYKIIIRSIAEIFHFDDLKKVSLVCFNGRVTARDKATGQHMDNCILSLQIKRQDFEDIDLEYVDCKACFKHFKGISGTKLHDQVPIVPLLQLSTEDKRFVVAHSVSTNESTNLATMDWEEFEHLVRELFDLEFNANGGEVKITQASHDGGVDAVAFDPDPIRGGKIVIQAKRYTNTVGVSAIRDLYGTVINEGANKGILITTSDYGVDSYNFAKGKPLTLLNGGHLLFLLEKHNKKARIDFKEAKM